MNERTVFANSKDLADYEAQTGRKVENPIIRLPQATEEAQRRQATAKNGAFVPIEEPKPAYVWAKDVKSEPTKWLWLPYFVDENINVFGGETGTGKTWNLCAIAAAVTTRQPDNMPGFVKKNGNVLYLGGEDGNSGMKERLEAVGADMSKIALRESGLDCRSDEFIAVLKSVKPELVIIDPLLSFVDDGTKINDYVGARQVTDRLRDIAREHHTCIILVVHPPKRGDYKLLYRFTGSGAFVDATRTATYIGYHPTEGNKRVGIQPKNNLNRTAPYVFELDPELGFRWCGDDSSITQKQVECTTEYELSGSSNNLRFYVEVVSAVLNINPQGLHMTAKDILKEYSKIREHDIDVKSFGHSLNNSYIIDALQRQNITIRKGSKTNNKQKYHIYYSDIKPLDIQSP